MKFKKSFETRKDISVYEKLNTRFVHKIGDVFIEHVNENNFGLVPLCHLLEKNLGIEKTTNWGYDFLLQDYNSEIEILCRRPMYEVMDFIFDATFNYFKGEPIDDINYHLKEFDIDFKLRNDKENPWIYIRDSEIYSDIEDIKKSISDICEQTVSHIEQSKKQLENIDDLRARKDAIRDCLSAMETFLKRIVNDERIEVEKACDLIESKGISPSFLIQEGKQIWKYCHRDFKDIRHGNPVIYDITKEDALYLCDKTLMYIQYLFNLSQREDFPFEK